MRGCLIIVRPSRHQSGVLPSICHRSGALIQLRDAISAAPSLLLEPSGRPSLTRTSASARLSTVNTWRFEHCEAFPTPVGGITVDMSPIGRAHLTPRRDIRCSEPPSGSRLDVHAKHTPELLHDEQRPMRGCLIIVRLCEALPTPVGGITVDLSPIGRAHPTP